MTVGVRTWAFWRRCDGAHFAWSLGRPALCFIRCAARTWRFGACASWYQGKVLGEFGYRCALRGEAGLTDPLQMSGIVKRYEHIKPGISHWHNYLDVWSAHKSCHWKNKDSTHIQIRNAKSTWQIYLDTTKGLRTIFAMLYIFWCSIKLVPGIELVVFPMMHVTVSLIFSQCS